MASALHSAMPFLDKWRSWFQDTFRGVLKRTLSDFWLSSVNIRMKYGTFWIFLFLLVECFSLRFSFRFCYGSFSFSGLPKKHSYLTHIHTYTQTRTHRLYFAPHVPNGHLFAILASSRCCCARVLEPSEMEKKRMKERRKKYTHKHTQKCPNRPSSFLSSSEVNYVLIYCQLVVSLAVPPGSFVCVWQAWHRGWGSNVCFFYRSLHEYLTSR